MNFNEKLDFLMNITKTKNSDLAMYTSLDSSYVSRLRRGKRNLSKNENFVMPMAEYFVKNIKEDESKVVEGFIENFSNFKFKKTNTWENIEEKEKLDTKNIEVYPGIQ